MSETVSVVPAPDATARIVHVKPMASDAANVYTMDYFQLHHKSCRAKKIKTRYEEVWKEARRKGITIDEELVNKGYKLPDGKADFDKFYEECDCFDMTCWPSDFSELGAGVVMYFHFVAFLATFLVLAFLMQTPALSEYMKAENLSAWYFDVRGHTSDEIDKCKCSGASLKPSFMASASPPDNFGSSCATWDSSFCTDGTYTADEVGLWCCRPWCYADKECANTKDEQYLSFSNLNVEDNDDSLVRSYTACGSAADALPDVCASFVDKPWPKGVYKEKTPLVAFGYIGPGFLGPDRGSNALILATYAAITMFLGIAIVIFHQYQIFVNQQVDDRTTQPNDFAILVHGLPSSATDESQIAEWFKQHALRDKDDVEIVKVVIAWEWAEYREKMRRLRELAEERKDFDPSDARIEAIDAEKVRISQELVSAAPGMASRLTSSGSAVLVFRYQDDMRKCLERWQNPYKFLFYRDSGGCGGLCWGPALPQYPIGGVPVCKIRVYHAPNPIDINWQDMGVSMKERAKKFMKTNALMFLVIVISFFVCWGMEMLQRGVGAVSGGMSVLPTLVVMICNAGVNISAKKFGEWEYHDTKVRQEASQCIKMTCAMCVNTAGVMFFLNLHPKEWYLSGGLINDVFVLVGITCVLQPLFFYFDFKYMIKGCMKRNKLTDEKLAEWNAIAATMDQPPKTADELRARKRMLAQVTSMQEAFEPSDLHMMKHYAYAVRTFIVCLFYAPLAPVVCIVGVIGLTVQYWMDKYLMLRWYRRPKEPIQQAMAMDGLIFCRYAGSIVLPIAAYVFITPSWDRDSHTLWWLLATLGGAIGYLIIPIQVWRRVSCLSCFSQCAHKASKIAPADAKHEAGLQDYYHAQHLWHGPDTKYHKSHFLYRHLPESKNPEILQPGHDTAISAASAGAAMGAGFAAAGGTAVGGSAAATKPPPDPSPGGPPTTATVSSSPPAAPEAPEPPPEPPGDDPTGGGVVTWEFETGHGYKKYDEDCHDFIERQYQKYKAGHGDKRIRVKTGSIVLSVDFERMTQLLDGHGKGKIREIRRTEQ